jgi:autotransporter-associated beta strand protein
LEPAHIEVNTLGNYSFTGDGEITGSGGISKSGTGKLIISSTNSYTGKTLLNDGTIEIPQLSNAEVDGPLGAAGNSEDNIIFNGGTLQITNTSSTTNRNILLESGGGTIFVGTSKKMEYSGVLTGPGKLTKSGGGTFIIRNGNNHSGGTVLNGGEIYLDNESAITNGLGSGDLTINLGALSINNEVSTPTIPTNIIVPASSNAKITLDTIVCQFTGLLNGEGNLELEIPNTKLELPGDWSAFEGQITATNNNNTAAWLLLGNKSGYGKSSIHLNGNVITMYRPSSSDTIEIGKLTGTSNSRLGAGGEDDDTITWKIGGLESSFTFDGSITERQYSGNDAVTSIIKTGQGNLSLTNANVYSGITIIEEGILTLLNTSGSGTGTGDVIIKNGGTLSGTGTIAGTVSVEQNGVISPGDAGFGSLNFESDVTFLPGSFYLFEYNNESQQTDGMNVGGTLTLDGILFLSLTGSTGFVHGDSIKILDANACAGYFSSITPSSPGTGLKWDTTTVTSDGFLRICNKDSCSGSNNNSIKKKNGADLKIFPNPNNGNFIIEIPGNTGNLEIKIETITGRILYNEKIIPVNNQVTINLNGIKSGLYLITITKDNVSSIKKIIIRN